MQKAERSEPRIARPRTYYSLKGKTFLRGHAQNTKLIQLQVVTEFFFLGFKIAAVVKIALDLKRNIIYDL